MSRFKCVDCEGGAGVFRCKKCRTESPDQRAFRLSRQGGLYIEACPAFMGLNKTYLLIRNCDKRTESGGFNSEQSAKNWAKKFGWTIKEKGAD